jgi:hypothetical protein
VELSIFAEPKVDCHVHVLDPARFPYRPDTHYAPLGQELGTPSQLEQVMDAYGTRHALSGRAEFGIWTRQQLPARHDRAQPAALQRHRRRAQRHHAPELQTLQRQGVVGVAWNVTFYGVDHYRDASRCSRSSPRSTCSSTSRSSTTSSCA